MMPSSMAISSFATNEPKAPGLCNLCKFSLKGLSNPFMRISAKDIVDTFYHGEIREPNLLGQTHMCQENHKITFFMFTKLLNIFCNVRFQDG